MTAGENAIRDELATRLSLIEPGLQHVASNYHLRNSFGADGFVDILARDSTGVFVVIELKKSDSTARQ
ncbi:MAG TPA: endonuclease NucS domain-containing protein, partial [Mycobacterium sp.]